MGDREPGGGAAGGAGLDLPRHQTGNRLYWGWEGIICVECCRKFHLKTFEKARKKDLIFIILCFFFRLSDGYGDWASQTRRQIRNDRLRKIIRTLNLCCHFAHIFVLYFGGERVVDYFCISKMWMCSSLFKYRVLSNKSSSVSLLHFKGIED